MPCFPKRTWAVAALLVAVFVFWIYPALRAAFPNYEHAMNDFTRHTRPVCIGRFLVDVPTQLVTQQYWQSIGGMGEITLVASEGQTLTSMRTQVTRRETELRATPHTKEGSVFREVISLADTVRLLIFRGNGVSTRSFEFETYLLKEGRLFKLIYGASNARLEAAKNDVKEAISSIHIRSNDSIPSGKGLCIDNGLVSDSPEFRLESTSVKFILPDYPGFEFSVDVNSTNSPTERGLFERVSGPLQMFSSVYPGATLSTKRKAKRTLAGMEGEELVTEMVAERKGLSPETGITGRWEYRGQAKSQGQPEVIIDFDYDFGTNAARLAREAAMSAGKELPPPPKRLTQEEVMAIWDSVLASFRPRPGAF